MPPTPEPFHPASLAIQAVVNQLTSILVRETLARMPEYRQSDHAPDPAVIALATTISFAFVVICQLSHNDEHRLSLCATLLLMVTQYEDPSISERFFSRDELIPCVAELLTLKL